MTQIKTIADQTERKIRTISEPEKVTMYHVGLNSNCPVHVVTVGGQTFPRNSEKVTGYGSETQRDKIRGAIVEMRPGQLEEIKKSANYKIVRSTRGRRARARVYDTRCRNYRPHSGDMPLSQFLYCRPVSDMENPMKEPDLPTIDVTLAGPPKQERRSRK